MTRQAFETEAEKHGFILDRLDKSGAYVQLITEQAWTVWKTSTAAALERAEKACEAIENERWALYKGRPPYTGTEPGRADNYVQGESGGAGLCVEAIRALKDTQ